MATEYKLSYPAAQINEKLGKIVDLDTTLTHEGEAADAKATGDAVGRKVDKVDGKGLSSNDYDNAAKAKVDAIPEDPKYTDTVYDDTEVKQGLNQLKGDLSAAVSQHNTDETAHNDLRIALQGLSDRINAALDSDDATLDQMSEVVAYIKSNKSLIDAITTSKVSVSDIVNDLVTNAASKPLSAAQGVVLKKLIDDLQKMIPEGGSGIVVTGAIVGQTVKISAVDESGKPTAWEAVDFPSGGTADLTDEEYAALLTLLEEE